MNTIAALTLSTMKADNNHIAINSNQHVQTEYITTTPSDAVKSSIDAITLECEQPLIRAAFHNLPPCDPIEISFKDVSYSVKKMFSKSKCERLGICPSPFNFIFILIALNFDWIIVVVVFALHNIKRDCVALESRHKF